MFDFPFPLHPIFVHFTVALSFTAFGAYVLAYILPQGNLKNDLSVSAREVIIERLQTDTSWIEGDTSYEHAYYQRFYDMSKARVLEHK